MSRFVLSDEAKSYLENIRAYLTDESGVRVARYVLRQIREAIVFLSRTPGAGHLRNDLTDAPVRFWSVYSYLIIYRPTPQGTGIVRVVHGGRDVAELLKQSDKN